MLNKLIAPFVGLLLALVMSSCSSGDDAKATNTTSGASTSSAETSEPVETDTPSPDEEYINQLHEAIPTTVKGNKADYIRLAGDFCGFLDDGYTPQGIINAWVVNGGEAQPASTLLQIAVPIYCPQHTKVVEKNLP